MLVSLANQALKEHRRAYLAIVFTLVLCLTGVIGVTSIVANKRGAAGWIETANRTLFWTVDYSADLAAGWITLATFATVLPIGLSILGMLHIRQWIYAKSDRDHLPLLLSYPVSRRETFLNVLILQGGFLLILAGLSAAVLLIGSLVGRFPIRAGNLLAMTVILWLYCLFVSLITLLAGNMSGSSWLGGTIGAGVFLFAVLIYLLPALVSLPAAVRWISPLAPYLDGNPFLNGIRTINWLGTAAWSAAAGLAAWLHFERLDVGN